MLKRMPLFHRDADDPPTSGVGVPRTHSVLAAPMVPAVVRVTTTEASSVKLP
jgi:hypothetical protein